MEKVYSSSPSAFSVDVPSEAGKSFLYKALLATVLTKGEFALATATSGATSSLLPGGRIAHLRFKIQLRQEGGEKKKSCNLSKQSKLLTYLKPQS